MRYENERNMKKGGGDDSEREKERDKWREWREWRNSETERKNGMDTRRNGERRRERDR